AQQGEREPARAGISGGPRRDGGADSKNLWLAVDAALRDLSDLYDKPYWRAWDAASRYADLGTPDPLAGLFTLLAAFGAVTGDPGTPRITALGQWAMARTRHNLPTPASPQLPAGDLLARLARFDGTAERHNVAWPWLEARTTAGAAREILAAADQASPSLRSVAGAVAESLGGDALPAWRERTRAPRGGPHARRVPGRMPARYWPPTAAAGPSARQTGGGSRLTGPLPRSPTQARTRRLPAC